ALRCCGGRGARPGGGRQARQARRDARRLRRRCEARPRHTRGREKDSTHRKVEVTAAQPVENFLQLLCAGLMTGAIYGLMCVGLSIIFGVMRVINFAQGEFMMLGMYFALFAFGLMGAGGVFGDVVAPFVAALLAGPAIFVVGVLLHRLLIRRVTGLSGAALDAEGHYAQLILTLGLALILSNGGLIAFGSAPVSIQTPLSSSPWIVGPLYGDDIMLFINQGQAVSAVIALAVV